MTKTILVTGATDGIGLMTAKTLANRGHHVILHGRSVAKLASAASEIGQGISTYRADLSSLQEAYDLAMSIRTDHDCIDVLINNAGVFKIGDPILPNGQDVRFVVNTLAPYALTKALLPIIPKAGRILNLSSAAQAPVDIAALKGQSRLGDMAAYAQSKRAITIWSHELAGRLAEGPVIIAVNPGSLLASKMVKEGFGVAGNDLQIGVDILCRLALDQDFANDSGKYWDNDFGGFSPVNFGDSERVMNAIEELV
ncbi:SDR family NAD(P)-dependent oxidoreductase [Ruegeria arenilitoris]|uniref:SDR family NAD(P)-dependent oxidoreductase n=1 Tax=Ruegeria arenilitoris TaxID=1173585 RepID=UPI0014813CE6|nr:SDR family NAD(P)-dependent oxidoreductase [Ruegeria arenilitoris]